MRKIKVIKCSSSNWWYNNLVGKIITIQNNELENDFIATDKYKRNEKDELVNTGMLLKSDCVLI